METNEQRASKNDCPSSFESTEEVRSRISLENGEDARGNSWECFEIQSFVGKELQLGDASVKIVWRREMSPIRLGIFKKKKRNQRPYNQ
jgi:hypothetical protein